MSAKMRILNNNMQYLQFDRVYFYMSKNLIVLFISWLLALSSLSAQNLTERWTGYFSYRNIVGLSTDGNTLMAASTNSIFRHDIATNENEEITPIDGLSGENITAIYYSKNFKTTLIGYQNGLIQLVKDNDNQIINLVEIPNRVNIPPDIKQINHFLEQGNIIYISTDFGIVKFNLSQLEFDSTYYVGDNASFVKINQIAVRNNRIWAASNEGVFTALLNDNLINFNNWNNIASSTFTHAFVFNNETYVVRRFDGSILRATPNFISTEYEFDNTVTHVEVLEINGEEKLFVSSEDMIFEYDSNFNEALLFFGVQNYQAQINSFSIHEDQLFIGDENEGLLQFETPIISDNFERVSPSGPILNRVFNLDFLDDELWVTFGEYDQFFNPFPLNRRGMSILKEQQWRNLNPEEFNNARVLVQATKKNESVFVSSYYDGLLEFKDFELVNQLDGDNSPIESASSSNNLDNRIGGSVITRDGSLYFINSLSNNPLKRINENGLMQSLSLPNAASSISVASIAHDSSDNIFIGSYRDGIFAYQSSTGQSRQITNNTAGANLPQTNINTNSAINALEVDVSNRLWIGTADGVRVMFNPGGAFTGNLSIIPIIITDTDGVAQQLLFRQTITDIKADGADNKWIATADSGVFQVSPTGQEVLNHFTRSNSPLPSNAVNSVEIDPRSGEVFFGTINGLVSYQSFITEAQEDLSKLRVFPNPVRPTYSGQVTIDGLSQNANVKITDIEGNLVFEPSAQGGSVRWDTTAFGKYAVASGVYLILVTNNDGQQTDVKKLMIIR